MICFQCSSILNRPQFSSVQSSVVCDSLQSHGLQHTRPPCPSPTPGDYANSCPLSPWCHPTISSSVVPFCSRLQSLPASGSFSNESVPCITWPKYRSFSFSISPSNESLGLTGGISLQSKGTLKSLLQHHSSKALINSLAFSFLYSSTVTSIHDCWKNHSFD